MEKRILAVLIAAIAGVAAVQANAQSNAGATAATANAPSPIPGYVAAGAGGVIVTNPFGLCWRSGADWTPDKAAEPCDAVPRAAIAPAPVAAAQPEPAPAPIAIAAAPVAAAPIAPPAPVIEKVTLATDVLFEFGKAELRPSGQQKLDELAKNAQGAAVDKVVVIGHADRIASEEYNKELSERRAQAVAAYLGQKGVAQDRLQVEAKGESQPVTGDDCKKLGAEKASNRKLVSCLQPDRRVEIELLGSREMAAGTTSPASVGSTSPGTPSGAGSSAK